MLIKKIMFYLILINLTISTSSYAQWKKAKGIYGGFVNTIAAEENDIYVGIEYGGIYYSSDGGVKWEDKNEGLPKQGIFKIVIHGKALIAATIEKGIFISTNKGNNWNKISLDLPNYKKLYALEILFNKIYIGTDSGLFCSADNGKTWRKLLSDRIEVIKATSDRLLAITGSGLFYSNEEGKNWKELMIDNEHIEGFGCDIAAEGKSIFAIKNKNIYYLKNYDSKWIKLPNPWLDEDIPFKLYVFDNELYAAGIVGNSAVYLQNGNKWQNLNKGKRFDSDVNVLVKTGKRLLIGSTGSIFISTDGGNIFNKLYVNFEYKSISHIFQSGKYILANSSFSDSDIYYSSDMGSTWNKTKPIPENEKCNLIIETINKNDSIFYASNNRKLFNSTDQGNTWNEIYHESSDTMNIWIADMTANCILLARHHSDLGSDIYFTLSTDGGNSWKNLDFKMKYNDYNFASLINEKIVIASRGKELYITDNKYENWHLTYSECGALNSRFKKNGDFVYYFNIWGALYYSKINNFDADTLHTYFINSPDLLSIGICTVKNGTLFCINSQYKKLRKLLYTSDKINWGEILLEGLPENCTVESIEVNEKYILLATDNGIWIRPLNEIFNSFNSK